MAHPNSSDYNEVIKLFCSEFGKKPSCVVSAPGRVNIIGEHIDYNGYPVLPIAIEKSIHVAAASNDDRNIRIVNQSPDRYAAFTCSVADVGAINQPPSWHDYALCGIFGVQQECSLDLKGLNIAVQGQIPPGQGLSSSSALVCAGALATLCLHGKYKKSSCERNLAQVCANSEKYVGTQGGGMDQAACLLSTEGCAQLISFNPLHCDPVTLPTGASFVVASSLSSINKAATSHFNCRVVEGRIACQILAKESGLNRENVPNLSNLQKQLGKSLDEMLELVDRSFHEEPYTLDEITELLGMTAEGIKRDILSENTQHLAQFQLKRRARHVFSEARRVFRFKEICDTWQTNSSQNKDSEPELRCLGSLMFESHESCRSDYECSHEALDKLVKLSLEHAYGARLTGAGWGGCIVALVPQARVGDYMAHLKREYYDLLGPSGLSTAVFSSPPSRGADVAMLE